MCVYVKLGVGWSLQKNGDFAYITNALSSVVYILDKDKIPMATDIANVASLSKLHETYRNLWTEFQTELEEANAIFYSNEKYAYKDIIDLGLKMSSSSTFVVRPHQLSRITLQLNEACHLNCESCGKVTCFPCMSCSSSNTNRVIQLKQLIKFLEFLAVFGLPELHILGGDPLLEYEVLRSVAIAYKQLNPNGNIWIYTNALHLLELNDMQREFLKNNTSILLILCEENLPHLKDIIDAMNAMQVRFEVQSRDLLQEFDDSVLCNNSIEFIQKNSLQIISPLNIQRQLTLYSNTTREIRNQCYDGKIFISVDGFIGVCKHYLLPLSIIDATSWVEIMHRLAKMWKTAYISPLCKKCELSSLCISCQYIHELYMDRKYNGPQTICFTQQSDEIIRKEEEKHA